MNGFLVAVQVGILAFTSVSGASVPLTSDHGGKDDALQTVPYVDASKYVGRWYQISRKPLPFEPETCTCTQQTLGVMDSKTLSVYNSCNENGPGTKLREIRGTATNDDPNTNARFTVDFNLPFKGQYWIIGLDPSYRWAVVSDPNRRSLYILSKTPTLSAELYKIALAEAAKQVATDKLKTTSHEGCTYPEASN